MLLTKYASQVAARKLQGMVIRSPNGGDVDAPESIALYSFALLLRLVQINVPSGQEAQSNTQQRFDFENHGMECAQTAVDDCGVFDYLHATMEALVKTPIRDSFSSVSNIPYDWQFSKDSSPLVLEGPSEQEELNAANVAYSSIGLEILSATIIAFQSTIELEIVFHWRMSTCCAVLRLPFMETTLSSAKPFGRTSRHTPQQQQRLVKMPPWLRIKLFAILWMLLMPVLLLL